MSDTQNSIQWRKADLDEALAEATTSEKLVLVDFTHLRRLWSAGVGQLSRCGSCRNIHQPLPPDSSRYHRLLQCPAHRAIPPDVDARHSDSGRRWLRIRCNSGLLAAL